MNIEDKVLELIKEKPLPVHELRERLKLSPMKMLSILGFLEKYELVETFGAGDNIVMMMKITPRGLQLLNLPNLPEDELPSNLLEVLERHYDDEIDVDYEIDRGLKKTKKGKTMNLYTPTQLTETNNWIINMAMLYDVSADDVIHALWLCAKDVVWAKLEQDVKEKRRRK